MCNIAVIDDGVNEKSLKIGPLNHNIEITSQLEIQNRTEYNPYQVSHGSICSAIIRKYSPNAVLSSIKILNERSKGGREQLLKAIKWCCENNIKILNLSLGTTNYRDFSAISKAVNEAHNKGLIIIGACNNNDTFTYPAAHANVIGVKCDKKRLMKAQEYIYHENAADGIEITTSGSHLLRGYDSNETSPSNSFAAPYITALVSNILEKYPSAKLEEIKEHLRKGAINYSGKSSNIFYRSIDWVDNAVLFRSDTEAKKVYPPFGFKVKGPVYIKCQSFNCYSASVMEYLNKNIRNLINISTVILDTVDLQFEFHAAGVNSLIEQVQSLGKNVIFLSDSSTFHNYPGCPEALNLKTWHPALHKLAYSHSLPLAESTKHPNIPFIIVFDFTGRKLLNTVYRMVNFFRINGFYAIGAVDTCKGILHGLEYINNIKGANSTNQVLPFQMLSSTYSPDFFIFGNNYSTADREYLNTVNNFTMPACEIIIADQWNTYIEDLITSKNKSKKIVFCKNISQETCGQYPDIKFFNAKKEPNFRWVYKYIINSCKYTRN